MSIVAMKKMTLLASGGDVDELVRRLIKLRCVDVARAEDAEGLRFTPCEDEVAALGIQLEHTKAALAVLRKYSQQKHPFFPSRRELDQDAFIADGRYARALDAVRRTGEIGEERAKLALDLKALEERCAMLEPWANLDIPLGTHATESTSVVFGSISAKTPDERLAELREAGAYIEQVNSDKSARYIVVFYLTEAAEQIEKLLVRAGFNRAALDGFEQLPLVESSAIELKMVENAKRETALLEELRNLALELDDIEALFDVTETQKSAAQTKLLLAQTEYCSVMTGWVPVDKVERVVSLLDKYTCAYELEDPTEHDDPPVLLRNNAFAKNFEWVVGMYSYPKYGTYDPTAVMSVFYCLIFGMMFADVGYGVLLMLACFVGVRLIKPKESMKRFLLMFGWCGLGSTIMGVLFGGYFGDLPLQIMGNLMGLKAPATLAVLVDPLLDPMSFMIYSLVMGGIHLISGMALKLYITWHDGHPLDAILDTVPVWLLFVGLGLLVVSPGIGKWVALAGVVAMVLTQGRKNKNVFMKLGGGLYSLYGLINFASDLISYSRIMALGLASAVVAQVVNILATMMGGSVVGTFCMVLVLIVGHVLNMAINILGSFVHTSRLQYIEFFGKFFTEGGRIFKPVSPADNYTIDNSNI